MAPKILGKIKNRLGGYTLASITFAALVYVFHLPLRLIEDKFLAWANKSTADLWEAIISGFITWGIPIVAAFVALYFFFLMAVRFERSRVLATVGQSSPIGAIDRGERGRLSGVACSPSSGRRDYDSHQLPLMWAELQVTNTSPALALRDVEVRISSRLHVEDSLGNAGEYTLVDLEDWQPVLVCWSERESPPDQLKTNIARGATKAALVAFSNDTNGGRAIVNTLVQDRPVIAPGAKIEVEVTSLDSVPWRGDFYIQCHPQYAMGRPVRFIEAQFEFVDWESWASSHHVREPQDFDREGFQPEST